MRTINIITAVCLVYMAGLVVALFIHAIRLDKLDRFRFFKNFKKGNFVWIYFVAIPLYMLGMYFNGQHGVGLFLNAVKSAVEIVVLKYEYDAVVVLAEANAFYMGVVYLCFVLVAINAGMFTFAIFGEKTINAVRLGSIRNSKHVYVLVGYNDRTRMIIDSIVEKNKNAKGKKNKVVLLGSVDGDVMDELFTAGVAVKQIDENGLYGTLQKLCGKFENKIVNVILNAENDTLNLVYCEELSKIVANTDYNSWSIDNPKGIIAYVFGDEQNEYAFTRLVEKTNGCVRYVNKYKLVAMDFLDKYPLTKFMTEEHLDYSTATIRPDVDVNVVMIGFGKTGQQLFLTSVQNNQFMTVKDEKVEHKKVNYFVYDKLESENDKNLNHNYYRFTKEFKSKFSGDGIENNRRSEEIFAKLEGKESRENYLPLPDDPANVSFKKIDINDTKFYEEIKGNLVPKDEKAKKNTAADDEDVKENPAEKEKKKAVNSVIIAFGNDLDNLDLAEKIAVKVKEWGLDNNTKIFVKIRDDDLYNNVLKEDYEKNGEFIVFGSEKDTVYNVDKVVNHEIDVLARRRHVCYESEYAKEGSTAEKIEKDAINKWYGVYAQYKRESNVYACMALRMKLNLMGYDYDKISSLLEDKTKEFMVFYQQGDEIVYQLDEKKQIKKLQDKPQVDYGTCVFPVNTLRNNLAKQEHERWNAYMICCGFIPASRAEIKDYLLENNKDEFEKSYRKHGNLTTYDGLIDFKTLKSETVNKELKDCDVIKYDYQIIDDVEWLLKKRGCKIVKLNK